MGNRMRIVRLAEGPVPAGGQDTGKFREMRTVAVGEVNDPGTFVREARWIGAPEGGYFLISVGNGYSGEPTAKVRVTVGPPGKYRLDKEPKS